MIVAFLTIMTIAASGGLYLKSQFSATQAQSRQLERSAPQQGFQALAEIVNHVNSIHMVDPTTGPTAAQVVEIEKTLDILYVRLNEFELVTQGWRDSEHDQIREMLRSIIDAGQVASDQGYQGFPTYRRRVDALAAQTAAALTRLVNLLDSAQRHAINAQSLANEHMIVATGGFLLLFALIASVALLLLRAESLAHARLRQAESRAKFLAYHDPMTGLLNRAGFSEHVEQRLDDGSAPSIALLDLDNFKTVNDAHGHDVGDQLLQHAAERLNVAADRNGAVIGRLGGDEFVAALPSWSSEGDLVRFCDRALMALRAPLDVNGVTLTPTASIGGAHVKRLNGFGEITLSRLLKAADLALYSAKHSGRDRFALFDRKLEEALNDRIALERALVDGLRNNEFELLLQPQFRLRDQRLIGFECLSRWRRNGELLAPQTFIAAAEESGHIRDLDHWALREAASLLNSWHRDGLRDIRLSVNLSAVHFRDREIVDVLQSVFDEAHFLSCRLVLEITETVALEEWDRVRNLVAMLRDLGASIALDDFGTGYSSLAYLRHLAIDELKIDRSIVKDIVAQPNVRAICSALMELGAALDLSVVAEGVETKDQAEILRGLGYDTVQGYLFGRPMSVESARALAREHAEELFADAG